MSLKSTIVAAIALTALPFTALANDSAANKAFVLEAMQKTLLAGNPEAVPDYFAKDIIQHNEMFANGIDAQKGVIAFLAGNKNFKAQYVRVIADGDMVALHARYEGFGDTPMIAFDVFRVENGKIAEHWDNLILEAAPNPSGHTQIDGATEITDIDKTEANKAKVTEFLTRSMINHEQVDITQYISPVTYIQHNPMVGDGLEGFGAFMGEMAKKGITMEYSKVHKVIGEGNFVLAMSEGAFGGQPQAFYDLFRLENGLIVEHWDVIAPMPGPDAKHNEAGKF
jgi:predicted SnoaL-like aldol condensation-catalyzing enzyme